MWCLVCLLFGCRRGPGVDVGVAESVSGAFQVMTSAWWTIRSTIAAATAWLPNTSPQWENVRLGERMIEAIS